MSAIESMTTTLPAGDRERRDLESLREAVQHGLASGPGIAADDIFAELRARYAHKD